MDSSAGLKHAFQGELNANRKKLRFLFENTAVFWNKGFKYKINDVKRNAERVVKEGTQALNHLTIN